MEKNLPANARDVGSIPGSGRLLGGGNGNPLQYFPWEIPWTEEPGGLQSMGLQRVSHDLVTEKQQIIEPLKIHPGERAESNLMVEPLLATRPKALTEVYIMKMTSQVDQW